MAHRKMQGNDDQRRRAGREARAHGRSPSEVGATRGADTQLTHEPRHRERLTHQERLDQRNEGKMQTHGRDIARPGDRDEPEREQYPRMRGRHG